MRKLKREKENKKVENFKELKREIARMRNIRTVQKIPCIFRCKYAAKLWQSKVEVDGK